MQGQSGLGKPGAELAGVRKAGGAEAQTHSLTHSRMCTNKARDPKHTHTYVTCNHSHTGTHSSHTHAQRHALTHASSHTLLHVIHTLTGTHTTHTYQLTLAHPCPHTKNTRSGAQTNLCPLPLPAPSHSAHTYTHSHPFRSHAQMHPHLHTHAHAFRTASEPLTRHKPKKPLSKLLSL